jgi:hypothetical protein
MPYEVSWYRPERVIYLKVSDAVTLQELAAGIEFIEQGVRSGIAPVHVIVDVQQAKSIPGNVLEIKRLISTMDKDQRDQTGWILLVGMNPLINTFVTVITQLLSAQYRNFKYPKLALEFLAKQDETLPDLAQATLD